MAAVTASMLRLRNQQGRRARTTLSLVSSAVPPPPPPPAAPVVVPFVIAPGVNVTPSGNPVFTLRDVVAYPQAPDRVRTANQMPVTTVRFVDDLDQPVTPVAADWSNITNKPATFPPTVPIAYSDVSGTPASLPPSGAAGGALAGTYPNPTLVGGPLSNYALVSSIPTTLPPNGPATGDLAGSYPAPTIKASVVLTGTPTVPGYLALGGGTLTGGLAGTASTWSGSVTVNNNLITRQDAPSISNIMRLQNFGITAAAQGVQIDFAMGIAGAQLGNGATISVRSLDTWAAPANESSQMIVLLRNAGAGVTGMTLAPSGLTIPGNIISNSGSAGTGIGYGAGAGGTIAQGAGSGKATTVVLNRATGNITMDAASLAANTSVTFTLTSSQIALNDLLHVQHISGGTMGAYTCTAVCAAGSAQVTVRNVTPGALAEAIVLKFMLFKGTVT